MKKTSLFVLIMVWLFLFCPCHGQSEFVVKYGEQYICGDSFELTLPDQPSTTTMVSRSFFNSYLNFQDQANNGERLLTLRVKLRNLTPFVYQGLKPESFQLTGYVRDRKQVYLPEMMQPYDFGSAGVDLYIYNEEDSEDESVEFIYLYNKYALFLPLRERDILLVYRVNPILINWDLTVNPQANYETTNVYGEMAYEPIPDQEPCNVVLLFPSIQDGVTRQVIEYERPE